MPKIKTDPKKIAVATKDQSKNNAVTKTATDIFAQIKSKASAIDNKKVDEWQKKWLAMPKNRKKYEHLQDAPQVVGEEVFAITNDIIDFVQHKEGGQSHVFNKVKESVKKVDWHKWFNKAKAGITQIQDKAMDAKEIAIDKAKDAKKVADKAKKVSGKTKNAIKKVKK